MIKVAALHITCISKPPPSYSLKLLNYAYKEKPDSTFMLEAVLGLFFYTYIFFKYLATNTLTFGRGSVDVYIFPIFDLHKMTEINHCQFGFLSIYLFIFLQARGNSNRRLKITSNPIMPLSSLIKKREGPLTNIDEGPQLKKV